MFSKVHTTFTNASLTSGLSLLTIPTEIRLQILRELLLRPGGINYHPRYNEIIARSGRFPHGSAAPRPYVTLEHGGEMDRKEY